MVLGRRLLEAFSKLATRQKVGVALIVLAYVPLGLWEAYDVEALLWISRVMVISGLVPVFLEHFETEMREYGF